MAGNEMVLTAHIPSTPAGTADEWYVPIAAEGTWRLTAAYFAPATAVAVHASNYTTATITGNDGAAGSDSSAIASHTTNSSGGVALALKTSIALTLTQRMDFTQGSQIKIAKTDAGTGAILDGTYTFVLEKVN